MTTENKKLILSKGTKRIIYIQESLSKNKTQGNLEGAMFVIFN
jgi:hypothetical protein